MFMMYSFFQHQRGVNIYSAFEISEFSRPTFKQMLRRRCLLISKAECLLHKKYQNIGRHQKYQTILHIEIQGTGIIMLKILFIIGIFAASSTASSEGSIREGKLNCQPIKGEIFSYQSKKIIEHKLVRILISTGVVPNKKCLYRIDDMVMTEEQFRSYSLGWNQENEGWCPNMIHNYNYKEQ